MNASAVTLLRAAKEIIAAEGWRQGHKRLSHPGHCLLDAIVAPAITTQINPLESERTECVRFLHQAGMLLYPQEWHALGGIGWNDASGRRVEEVFAVYDKAIELAGGA